MRRTRAVLAIAVAAAVSASGCTTAEPDWDAAQARADAFLESGGGAGALGGASGRMSAGDDRAPGEGTTLTFPGPTRVDLIELVCFGDGEAAMSVEAQHSGGSVGLETDVVCDGEPTRVKLPDPRDRITEVTLDGVLRGGSGAVFAAVIEGEVG
ncbi:hypothetical protein [Microcella alkalica]|uniref:hypothetical protein n=1 Tax=Microcella alkalica TaxID=355930 RepID=UPI00145EFC04|nr:hypothetical protein [Microcella alkalica]